jgi:hypothetical protein
MEHFDCNVRKRDLVSAVTFRFVARYGPSAAFKIDLGPLQADDLIASLGGQY